MSQWAMIEWIKSAWVILNKIFVPNVPAFSLTYCKFDQYVISFFIQKKNVIWFLGFSTTSILRWRKFRVVHQQENHIPTSTNWSQYTTTEPDLYKLDQYVIWVLFIQIWRNYRSFRSPSFRIMMGCIKKLVDKRLSIFCF